MYEHKFKTLNASLPVLVNYIFTFQKYVKFQIYFFDNLIKLKHDDSNISVVASTKELILQIQSTSK